MIIQEINTVQLEEVSAQWLISLKTDIGDISGRVHKVTGGYVFASKQYSTKCIETRSFLEALYLIQLELAEHLENSDYYEAELELLSTLANCRSR